MNLKGILKVGDEVIVDVVDSEGVSRGDVLEFYRNEFVVTIGRKYITTERYGKNYKYDIETGIEVTDSLDKRRLFPTYNQLVAFYRIQKKQSLNWYLILQELQRLSEITIW